MPRTASSRAPAPADPALARLHEPGLDHGQCYEALRSRDERFDGRFYVGVRTTGIYCRPICPSRTPRAANVDFYAHPAAAEDAGFRPCRRCRPETAPGTARWRGSAAVVDRAERLIDEGALDEGSVADLAERLHVGERHLRRLFAARLGTTPDAVARSRRAHLARRLLAETDLKVADVAFAAGFGSVRQCNDVVRRTFQATPTQLRAAGPGASSGALTLRLPARPPFGGDGLLDWFRARAVEGLEEVDRRSYQRTVAVGDGVGSVVLTPDERGVTLAIDLPTSARLGPLVARTRHLFGLDADPEAIDAHLRRDPLLAPHVDRRPGRRVPGCWSGFEAAVRAVIGQQISVAAARTVLGRIVTAHGSGPEPSRRAFPEPEDLVDAPIEELGIFGRRAATVRAVASAVLDGAVALDGSMRHDELVGALVALPGVGPWTAEYVALRLGEPDAFPAGDLHLMRALGVTTERAARDRAEPWRPWRAHAALHLWHIPREDLPCPPR